MRRIHERIHVNDGDRLDTALPDHPRGALNVGFLQRRHDFAVRTDTFTHHQHVAPRYDQLRRIPIQLEGGNSLSATAAKNVAKTFGGDQCGLDAFAFENRVG